MPGLGLRLQVSEFVKLVIILLVARYLTDLKRDELEIREMLILSGLVAVPVVLVLAQPDLGTSLTYIAILVAGAFIAGLRWKYVAAIAVVAVFVVPVGWHFLKDYQKARIEAEYLATWIKKAGLKKLGADSWREVAILCPRKA